MGFMSEPWRRIIWWLGIFVKGVKGCRERKDGEGATILTRAAVLYVWSIACLALRAKLSQNCIVEAAKSRLVACTERSDIIRDVLAAVVENELTGALSQVREVVADIREAGGWPSLLSKVDEDTRIALQVGMSQLRNQLHSRVE